MTPHSKLPVVRSLVIGLCIFALTFAFVRQAAATTPTEAPTAEVVPIQQEADPNPQPSTPPAVPNLSSFALLGVGGLMTVVFGLGMLVMTQDQL